MFTRLFSGFTAFFLLVQSLLGLAPVQEPKCAPAFNGTFLQSWYSSCWDDERWQDEIEVMKEAGVEYLILQDIASLSSDGEWTLYYPSELDVFSETPVYCDVIENALSNCTGTGIKVFIGLADFEKWWVGAGFTRDFRTVCSVSADMVTEIYGKYYADYSDCFYGWYFTPEINNNPIMKASSGLIAKGLNKIIAAADSADSGLPLLLSPYFTEYLAVPSVLSALPEWTSFMKNVHFRDGDIFCPQDAVGAGWTEESHLEKVWQMYSAAVSACPADVKLWANCENFTSANDGGLFSPPATVEKEISTCTLDRFVRQMNVASKYCENIITFSFSHYYSPYCADDVYYRTYLSYLENGYTLESTSPSAPEGLKCENGTLCWQPCTDDTGIAYYLVSENGKPVERIDSGNDLSYPCKAGKTYTVTALDAAGNAAAASYVCR